MRRPGKSAQSRAPCRSLPHSLQVSVQWSTTQQRGRATDSRAPCVRCLLSRMSCACQATIDVAPRTSQASSALLRWSSWLLCWGYRLTWKVKHRGDAHLPDPGFQRSFCSPSTTAPCHRRTGYPSFVGLQTSASLPPHYLSGKVAITANKEASSGFYVPCHGRVQPRFPPPTWSEAFSRRHLKR